MAAPLVLATLAIVGMVYQVPQDPTSPYPTAPQTFMVPLKAITYNVNIVNTIVETELIQYYHNDQKGFIETSFLFPVSVDAAFTSMEIFVKGEKIKAVVREKEEAKETYEAGKEQGKIVGYAGQEQAKDIMMIKIGNIPPGEDVTVTFKYVESIEVQANKYMRLIISSTLTPRYYSRYHPKETTPDITTTEVKAYPWKINVRIQATTPITAIKCTSHPVSINYQNGNTAASVQLSGEKVMYPDKNFVLLYKTQDLFEPSVTLSRYTIEDTSGNEVERYCAHLVFMADLVRDDFDALTASESSEAFPSKFNSKFNEVRGEFIFIVDRSGSMDGARWVKAREALIAFLQKLPPDSYFDVISFGTEYTVYSKEGTIRTTQQSIAEAVGQIRNWWSDMGGTEIYPPMIEALLKKPLLPNYPRYIFLLTDGDVSNTESIVNLVENNRQLAVVNTLGIGSGASEQLVKEVARAGRGTYEFVTDTEDFTEKISFMLAKTPIPVIDSIQVGYPQAFVEFAAPDPEALRFVTLGQLYHVFLFFNENFNSKNSITSLEFSYIHPQSKATVTKTLSFDPSMAVDNEYIPRLGIFNLIKNLERHTRNLKLIKNAELDAVVPIEGNIDDQVLSLSLQYQILSEQTAFVMVSDQVVTENPENTTQVSVPNLESADYYKDGDGYGYDSSYAGASAMKGGPMLPEEEDDVAYVDEYAGDGTDYELGPAESVPSSGAVQPKPPTPTKSNLTKPSIFFSPNLLSHCWVMLILVAIIGFAF